MESKQSPMLSTGVPGLDPIMRGGLAGRHAYLVKGTPGTGKTTVALQYLSEGVRCGESTVYISFSESLHEIRCVADSHGFPIDEIEIVEMAADISRSTISGSSIFYGAEVDIPEVVTRILDVAGEVRARRLAVDSLTELRNMAESRRVYRRALFQLKASLEKLGTTTIFVGDSSSVARTEAESLVHGVINLEMVTPMYGPATRHLEVEKLRGTEYETGYHDFSIETGGLRVFPRIRPRLVRRDIGGGEPLKSGVRSLDELLGGGLDSGTASLVMGPSGTGKSSVVMQFAVAAAKRNEKALVYSLTEGIEAIKRRSELLGIPLQTYLDRGLIDIRRVDPGTLSPGQFVYTVSKEVTEQDLAFVALDSLTGYVHAISDSESMITQFHDLLTYLGSQGVVTMFIMTLRGLFGPDLREQAHLSYLADTILYLRYFEDRGAIHKSIAAVKQRTREHDRYVRELILDRGGIRVGEPVVQPRGLPARGTGSGRPSQDLFDWGGDGD